MHSTIVKTQLSVNGIVIHRVRLRTDHTTGGKQVLITDPVFGMFSIDNSFSLAVRNDDQFNGRWRSVSLEEFILILELGKESHED